MIRGSLRTKPGYRVRFLRLVRSFVKKSDTAPGKSVSECAGFMGVGTVTLYRWLSGAQQPSIPQMDRICTKVGFSEAYVWFGKTRSQVRLKDPMMDCVDIDDARRSTHESRITKLSHILTSHIQSLGWDFDCTTKAHAGELKSSKISTAVPGITSAVFEFELCDRNHDVLLSVWKVPVTKGERQRLAHGDVSSESIILMTSQIGSSRFAKQTDRKTHE